MIIAFGMIYYNLIRAAKIGIILISFDTMKEESIDERIIEFINKHHVLTLASCSKNEPWCANCFYVYIKEKNLFVFTSDESTKHIKDIMVQDLVAGSVVLETSIVGKIKGLQFRGKIKRPDRLLLKKVRTAYLKRFPVAMLMKTTLWVVEATVLKYTDNRLGFGKKLIWNSSGDDL